MRKLQKQILGLLLFVSVSTAGCGMFQSGPTIPAMLESGETETRAAEGGTSVDDDADEAEAGSRTSGKESGADDAVQTGEAGADSGDGQASDSAKTGKTMADGMHVSKENQKLYRTDADGNPADGWHTAEDGSIGYCVDGYLLTGFQEIDGFSYLFSDAGVMQTGAYTMDDGTLLMFTDDGKQYINSEYMTADGTLYFFGNDGTPAHGEVTFLDGSKGYADENGILYTGCHLISGLVYHYSKTGRLIRTVDPAKPMVALTYDDGPSENVDELISLLQDNGGLATFFLLGKNIVNYPERVARIADSGNEAANHTYNHVKLTDLNMDATISEIGGNSDLIESLCGIRPTVVRPPRGVYDDASCARAAAVDNGYPLIYWSIDTRDWEHRDAAKTVETIRSEVRDGSIILMHDPEKSSIEASKVIIPELVSEGYQLVTVTEMATGRGGMEPGKIYYSFYPEDVTIGSDGSGNTASTTVDAVENGGGTEGTAAANSGEEQQSDTPNDAQIAETENTAAESIAAAENGETQTAENGGQTGQTSEETTSANGGSTSRPGYNVPYGELQIEFPQIQ